MDQPRDLLISFACQLASVPFSLLSPSPPSGKSFSSIVILKPCCIGDVVLASTTVSALRQAYPKARIAFCVSTWAKDAIRHNPKLDEIIECGNVGSGRGYGWHEYMSLVRRIKQGKFELAVVLERSPLLSLIPFLAGVPHRSGIDSSGRGFSLTVKTPWHRNQHEAELYLDVARALGIAADHSLGEFYSTDDESKEAASILEHALIGTCRSGPDDKLAMIHPGGAANPGMALSAKRWPPNRYAELIRRLISDGWTVLLGGAPSDRSVADDVKAALYRDNGNETGAKVVDLVGELSLGQFASIARRCGIFVGNDTGPMHIAAAVGTPTVAIFGPSSPNMYAPRGPRVTVLYRKVDCSPCFVKGRFDSTCRDFRCIRAIEVDDVWQAIHRVLADK